MAADEVGRRDRRRWVPVVEQVESRQVLTTFGAAWTDGAHLTLSFAPDGSKIASHTSNLFQALNAQGPTATWQRTILQAFQTWASRTNINIGLKSDGGQAFGTTGKLQQDPRFGDIRVGAQPMADDALSVSIPFDPALSGTWSGDMLLNSATFSRNAQNLFEIALHEAGHVFGLDHSTDPASVMASHLNDRKVLSANDVASIQGLYGTRAPDVYEGSSGNASPGKAAAIPIPGGYTGRTPLVLFADLTDAADVDLYQFKPTSGYQGSVTVRLQSAGISLLAPKLSLVDARGRVQATAQANTGFGDVVTLSLSRVDPQTTYYVRVESAARDVFGVGSYGLAVSFDTVSAVPVGNLDRVLRQGNRGLKVDELAASLRNPGTSLINLDRHTDDSLPSATRLATTPGYQAQSHYDAVGSLSDGTDVDVYRIESPRVSGKGTVALTASVRALGNTPTARIQVLDRDLLPVAAKVVANADGLLTVQATGLKASASYYLRIVNPTGRVAGNYALDANFSTKATQLTTFARGALTTQAQRLDYNLYVGRSQLFQFLLGAWGTAGTGLSMEILNARGQLVFQFSGQTGDTTSARALLLTPGSYRLRIQALSAPVQPVTFSLGGGTISDPIGPRLLDPTFNPVFADPKLPGIFTYPGLPPTTTPYAIALA